MHRVDSRDWRRTINTAAIQLSNTGKNTKVKSEPTLERFNTHPCRNYKSAHKIFNEYTTPNYVHQYMSAHNQFETVNV